MDSTYYLSDHFDRDSRSHPCFIADDIMIWWHGGATVMEIKEGLSHFSPEFLKGHELNWQFANCLQHDIDCEFDRMYTLEFYHMLLGHDPDGVSNGGEEPHLRDDNFLHSAVEFEAPYAIIESLINMNSLTRRSISGGLAIHAALAPHGDGVRIDGSPDNNIVWMLMRHHPESLGVEDYSGELPLHVFCHVDYAQLDTIRMLVEAYPAALLHKSNGGVTPARIVFDKNQESFPECKAFLLDAQEKYFHERCEAISEKFLPHLPEDVVSLIQAFDPTNDVWRPTERELEEHGLSHRRFQPHRWAKLRYCDYPRRYHVYGS